MRAGQRGIFDDRDRRPRLTERHVGERYRLFDKRSGRILLRVRAAANRQEQRHGGESEERKRGEEIAAG